MVTLKVIDNEPVSLSASDEPTRTLDAGLTTVVTENNYNDLRNKPSIQGVELAGNKTLNDLHGYTQDQIDSKLSAKANRSEIPSLAGYATEAWVESQNYASEDDFYTKGQTDTLLDAKADASDIPTKTSDLTNDSGYITDAGVTSFNGNTGAVTYTAPVSSVNGRTGAVTVSVPSKTSDLTNDSGFITLADLPIYNGGVQ